MRDIVTINSLSVEDIENAGFNTDNIDDSTLVEIASLMNDMYIKSGGFAKDLTTALIIKQISRK